MRKIYYTLFVTAVLLLSLLSVVAAQTGVVRYIPDGDTLVMQNGEVVRLVGIDAPEMGKDGQPDGYYAVAAREQLSSLVTNTSIILRTPAISKDRYGRTLATVFLPGGINVNEIMVSYGAAMAYYHSDVPVTAYHRMITLQYSAMLSKIGMWASVQARVKQAGPFVGNRKSRRFFTTTCDGADRIAERNRVVFEDIWNALLQGYVPARHCHIWPDQ